MARLAVKRFFILAWDVFTIVGALGAVTLIATGTALQRAEAWVDKRLPK